MILMPQSAQGILSSGGGLRMSVQGLLPQTMVTLAAAARQGGGRLELIVGDVMLMPQTMQEISAAGHGHVLFDIT